MSRLQVLLSLSLILGGSSASAAQATGTATDSVAFRWAQRLLQDMHASETFIHAIDTGFVRQRQAGASNVPPVFFDSVTARLRRVAPQFTDSIATIYVRLLTAPDLEAMVRFYESPLGQRYAQAQSAAQVQVAEMARRWGMRLALDVMKDLVDEGLMTGDAVSTRTPSPAGQSAYVASMKSDLRNLVVAEEAYFADSVKYTENFPALHFTFSTGTRLVALKLTPDGWWARIGNANTATTCVIFIGSTPTAPATKEGEPQCQ